MQKTASKSRNPAKSQWAQEIAGLRRRMNLSQTLFGHKLHSSAMAISRWERSAQEPTAESYIELGNLAGDPLCWYFWGRAGLRGEDLMRVMPILSKRLGRSKTIHVQVARAGSGRKKAKSDQLIAIPLLKSVAAAHGQKGGGPEDFQDAPVETMIAAPSDWCPNPSATTCMRVRGHSMAPLIYDGYILAIDSSQRDPAELGDKIVIAWNKDVGLTVSRLKRFGSTEVLQPENREYESIVMDGKQRWKILGKVLWWIGKAS